jgi:translocation and assembly module TamA
MTAEASRVRGFGQGRVLTFYLRLLQEAYTVGDQKARSRVVLPGVRFSQRHWDNPARPRSGYSYSLEVRGSDQILGSDVGLVQGLANGNVVLPLPWRLSLLGRVQGATTYQKNPFADVPASLRFFAGGDQSVRGYAYQSLGPRDASGAVVGGKKLLVGSLELDRAIGENWGVAVFYDAGNAFNSLSDFHLARGAGIGVRRYTVVGPVKIDLARQIASGKHVYRVHVGVGFQW